MKRLLTFLMLILILSCEESENKPNSTIYHIDEELLPYLETFLEEAESRGFQFEAENLIMEFAADSYEICGECIYTKNGGQRKVTIVRNSLCWLDAPTQNRESLVFHELGHCLLVRDHRDEKFPSGAVASIMHSEYEVPYSPCIYDIEDDNSCNKTERRGYYVNELFDPSTPAPDWAD